MKTWMLSLLLAILSIIPALAGETDKAWLGHHFQPEQCVRIRAGEETFTRKLCRIDYRIKKTAGAHNIEGQLTFNTKFVPRLPQTIDLEILLIDREFACIEQVDMSLVVDMPPVRFALRVATGSNALYLRTYYTLHYE